MSLLWSFVLCTLLAIASAQQNCAVQNLQLSQEDDGSLSVTWSTGGNAAGCDFTITFSSDADSQQTETISIQGSTEYQFSKLIPCSTVTIDVAPVGGTAVSASQVIQTSVTDAPELVDMITSCNSIEMIWDAQPYEENMCEVTHFQLFCLSDTHNFTIPQAVNDVTHRSFDIFITVLRPDIYYTCNGFIFTTLGGFSPASPNIEFWSNLDSVRDLKVTENENSISASWEAPLNSEECGVAYDVTYENEVLGTNTIEVVGLAHEFDIPLVSCTSYTITVTPISFTGSKGTPVSTDIKPSVRVGDVRNLQVLSDRNSIVVSWAAADVGLCEVSYIVEHLVDGELYETKQISGTATEFERIPCAVSTFRVQPVSEDVSGNTAVVELELTAADITWIGEVSNIQMEGDKVTWDAPVSVGLCSISYRVIIENVFGASAHVIFDTSADFRLIPCSNNIITITGISGTVIGEPVAYQITAPDAEFSAPVHISTIPDFTSARVMLRADSFDTNTCDIGTVEVQCANNMGTTIERSIAVTDDAARVFAIDLEDLDLDTIYDCKAAWKNSDSGNEFSFRTIRLLAPTLSVSNVNEDSFLVSWEEHYGRQFVNSYTLKVGTVGPLHAVRDDCEVERGVTRTYTVDRDTQRQPFDEGFPNYEYVITLDTSYTLGVELRSDVLHVQTETGVPGIPEGLSYRLLEEHDGYNVTAVLNWITPCDLNGDLRGFTARVVGTFEFGGTEHTVEYSAGIKGDGDLVNSNFLYAINEVNPFFTYRISLATDAAVQGDSAHITIIPPDACLC